MSAYLALMKQSKPLSILVSMTFYIAATALAILVFRMTDPGLHILWRLALADLAATAFIFLGSVLLNNSSMYDPYWSVKPMVLAAGYVAIAGVDEVAWWGWLAVIGMQLYGLRLTSNFYRDWPGFVHEDWRYINFRKQFPRAYWAVSFGGIHLFPTIQVFLACLPLYAIFRHGAAPNRPALVVLGFLGVLLAVALAYVADEQMRRFRCDPANEGKNMDRGLWSLSRHPNYAGEVLTWWGLALMAVGMDLSYWWTAVGALSIHVMFHVVSIPMLDERSLERRPDFGGYMKQSRALWPIPRRR